MPIAAGTRLGPYEVSSPLGAGGMGEVYKARDTRLDRAVAIKVLPSHLSGDPDLKQRFEREARAISSLSHPHICALHDVGTAEGLDYLVMELLEGETLAERLAKGTPPLPQVLRIGVEIAEALGAAHRQGIVHRDLKPANVMLTKSGVKLLDFGLAKSAAGGGEAGRTSLPTEAPQPLTEKGTILGTFQYMAPEQLEGRDADARTDIFALGALLHEMATGKKAFSGTSRASLIGAIMNTDPPPVSSVLPMSPPALDHVVRKCLAKEPDDRWQSAADVAGELRWIAQEGASSVPGVPSPGRAASRRREAVAWAAFLLALAAALALWFRSPGSRSQAAALVRASLTVPEDFHIRTGGAQESSGPAVISPDGRALVFAASSKDRGVQLWIRPLDAAESRPLPGTEQAMYPFWSPDGKLIAFFAGGKLKSVSATGGEPLVLADAQNGRGGAWGPDGTILFAPDSTGGLFRVAAAGGTARPATQLDASKAQETHRFPCFLPDGRHFLYYASADDVLEMEYQGPSDGVYLGSLDGGADRFLVRSESEAQLASGHLLFMRRNTLFAVPFDPVKIALSGEPSAIVENAELDPARSKGGFTVSKGGILAYHPGVQTSRSQLVWLDRTGKRLGTVGEPALLGEPAISPDGKRVAVSVLGAASRIVQIWIYDLANGTGSPFTFGSSPSRFPVWSPDGSRIFYLSRRQDRKFLFVKPAGGAGEQEVLPSEGWTYPTDSSRDGRFLALTHYDRKDGWSVRVLPLSGDKTVASIASGRLKEPSARFSPDSRWVAYNSLESGRSEIYVAPFPETGGKRQVSTGGGDQPRWRRDGRELFFVSDEGELMSVAVEPGPSIEFGPSKVLFKLPSIPNTSYWFYDAAPEGDRFLVTYPVLTKQEPIALVLNWPAALLK